MLGLLPSGLSHWPSRDGRTDSRARNPMNPAVLLLGHWRSRGSVTARGTGAPPPALARITFARPNRQRKERAVRKFQIPAEYLHLPLPTALAFDYELRPDRKP